MDEPRVSRSASNGPVKRPRLTTHGTGNEKVGSELFCSCLLSRSEAARQGASGVNVDEPPAREIWLGFRSTDWACK
ncbi:hypothetical protein E2C01_052402 [Portunus trituberculatus]|uniref:Uncharacterized protein n=1 Tax=Portunus trituberculatus TaxID=210409 RepID=A0A5B7GMW5_PORTR|nr:hypothetical protein [Portunus trituberculatus]